MDDEPEHREARGGGKAPLQESGAPPAPASGALSAAARLAREAGRKLGEEGSRLAGKVSEQAAARIAAGLQPVRDLGRTIEGRRIAVGNAVQGAVSGTAAKAKRTALGVGAYGAITAGAAGEAAVAVLLSYPLRIPFEILATGAKFLQARREIAEALAKYDQAAAEAAQAERERLAQEAVARLTAWDHRTTRHHRSPYLHVSVGPGKAEAWGMLLRGPHAGRSLASLAPEILAALWAEVPDQATADALEAWRQVVSRAVPPATGGGTP